MVREVDMRKPKLSHVPKLYIANIARKEEQIKEEKH